MVGRWGDRGLNGCAIQPIVVQVVTLSMTPLLVFFLMLCHVSISFTCTYVCKQINIDDSCNCSEPYTLISINRCALTVSLAAQADTMALPVTPVKLRHVSHLLAPVQAAHSKAACAGVSSVCLNAVKDLCCGTAGLFVPKCFSCFWFVVEVWMSLETGPG